MLIVAFVFIFVAIAFGEMGLAALFVLPMTLALLTSIVTFFAMLAGVEGSAVIFLWSAAITAGGFLIMWGIGRAS